MSKFYNDQDERHKGRLHWPGFLGIPIRHNGDLILKNEDYHKLVFVSDFHFHLFDLSKEEDREYYQWVNDRVYGGFFTLVHKERFWDKENGKMLVYMEWCQNYFELPPNVSAETSVKVSDQNWTLSPTQFPNGI